MEVGQIKITQEDTIDLSGLIKGPLNNDKNKGKVIGLYIYIFSFITLKKLKKKYTKLLE